MDLKENTGLQIGKVPHPWESARAHILWQLLKKKLAGRNNNPIEILDIGSGDLFLSLSLEARDVRFKITSFDIAYSNQEREILERITEGRKISLVSAWDEIPENKNFAAVILMDVMEHVADDYAFLKEIVSNTNAGSDTVFVITVPAWNYLFSAHDHFLGHYRRYTRKEMEERCQATGLQVMESGYFFISLWKARMLQFIFLKMFRVKKRAISDLAPWKGGPALSAFIRSCLLADYYFTRFVSKIGIHLPGLSVYAVCKTL